MRAAVGIPWWLALPWWSVSLLLRVFVFAVLLVAFVALGTMALVAKAVTPWQGER